MLQKERTQAKPYLLLFHPKPLEISAKAVFQNRWLLLPFYFSLSFVWLFILTSVRSKSRNWCVFNCCKTQHTNCKQEIESKNLNFVVNTAIKILAYNFKACVSSLIMQCSNNTGKTDFQIIITSYITKNFPSCYPPTSYFSSNETSCCVRSSGKFSL